MTTCPACLTAEQKPRTDAYRSGCVSCEARALAAIGGGADSFGRLWADPQRLAEGRREFERWAGALRRERAGAMKG